MEDLEPQALGLGWGPQPRRQRQSLRPVAQHQGPGTAAWWAVSEGGGGGTVP